jgi:hypothetical protein
MSLGQEIPLSSEAELDRQMSEIIADWVKRGLRPEDVDRYQELSMRRARLMNGGNRVCLRGRKSAVA